MKIRSLYFAIAAVLYCSFCTATGVSRASPNDRTSEFIGYLNYNWENHRIDKPSLQEFIAKLQRGELVNPILDRMSSDRQPFEMLKSKFARDLFDEYLAEDYIDKERVLIAATSCLDRGMQRLVQQREVQGETKEVESKMVFHQIEPGKFKMKVGYYPIRTVPVRLTRSFEMQSSRVKEWHWAMIMGENPSNFAPNTIKVSFFPFVVEADSSSENWVRAEREVQYQLDHDVTGVGWKNAQEFISRLNRLSVNGNSILNEIIEDHRPGDQFRLPTEAEWSFVLQYRGKSKNAYDRHGELLKEFSPWIFQGKEFFGLNVRLYEWTADCWIGDKNPKRTWHFTYETKVDPQEVVDEIGEAVFHVTRISWYPSVQVPNIERSNFRGHGGLEDPRSLRLVRIRQK